MILFENTDYVIDTQISFLGSPRPVYSFSYFLIVFFLSSFMLFFALNCHSQQSSIRLRRRFFNVIHSNNRKLWKIHSKIGKGYNYYQGKTKIKELNFQYFLYSSKNSDLLPDEKKTTILHLIIYNLYRAI